MEQKRPACLDLHMSVSFEALPLCRITCMLSDTLPLCIYLLVIDFCSLIYNLYHTKALDLSFASLTKVNDWFDLGVLNSVVYRNRQMFVFHIKELQIKANSKHTFRFVLIIVKLTCTVKCHIP